ncbi:unnamed protein product [Pocillopora meandrina]|uniref:Fibrinogen C-terminal domain-containing protein n=1 Tax=Pocillopora meandrina TaxID=46732 RepID=A0AAU9XA00_9CNID|nr:unnamed protein product [Pocillopora meandrina]
MLRVDLEDFEGNITYAEYTNFNVADEAYKYRLFVEGYNGTAGDSMTKRAYMKFHFSNMEFSTNDQDNDGYYFQCSRSYKGAWWYKSCHQSKLNGLYLNGSHLSNADGVNWLSFRGHRYSLKRTKMKVKTIA